MLIWIIVGNGLTEVTVGAAWGLFGHFSLIFRNLC